MKRVILLSNFLLIAGGISCRAPSKATTKDVGLINTEEGSVSVLYADKDEGVDTAILKKCASSTYPAVKRNCEHTTGGAIFMEDFLTELPFDTGNYERSKDGLQLATRELEAARTAAASNPAAARRVPILENIAGNLTKIVEIFEMLQIDRQDITMRDYDPDFAKLTKPFSSEVRTRCSAKCSWHDEELNVGAFSVIEGPSRRSIDKQCAYSTKPKRYSLVDYSCKTPPPPSSGG